MLLVFFLSLEVEWIKNLLGAGWMRSSEIEPLAPVKTCWITTALHGSLCIMCDTTGVHAFIWVQHRPS